MTPIYCLTLRQTPERTAIAEAHFRERGITVSMVHGVHGRTWGIGTEQWFRERTDAGNWAIPPGHVGLNLSHWMLWSHLWHARIEEALILEDDAVLPPDFLAQLALTRAALPADWQFCYVGSVGTENYARQTINDRLCKLSDCVFGTHAYLVRRTALPVLLDAMQSCQDHVDILLWRHALPKLSWYVAWPNLVRQRTADGDWEGCCHQDYRPPNLGGLDRQRALDASDKLPGWCPPEKAAAIYDLILQLGERFPEPLACVELGVWFGKSLLPAAFALKRLGRGSIIGVDPYTKEAAIEGLSTEGHEGQHRAAWANGTYGEYQAAMHGCQAAIAANGLSGCASLRVLMPDELDPPPGLHYLHLDDSHATSVSVRNVQRWLPHLLPGGILVLDDCEWPTVQAARRLIQAECRLHSADTSPGRRWEIYVRPT